MSAVLVTGRVSMPSVMDDVCTRGHVPRSVLVTSRDLGVLVLACSFLFIYLFLFFGIINIHLHEQHCGY